MGLALPFQRCAAWPIIARLPSARLSFTRLPSVADSTELWDLMVEYRVEEGRLMGCSVKGDGEGELGSTGLLQQVSDWRVWPGGAWVLCLDFAIVGLV